MGAKESYTKCTDQTKRDTSIDNLHWYQSSQSHETPRNTNFRTNVVFRLLSRGWTVNTLSYLRSCALRAQRSSTYVRPLVYARNGNNPKCCDVASGRADCHSTYLQQDCKKSNNHRTSVHKIYRMSQVCQKHFLSTLKSISPYCVRSSTREKLLYLLQHRRLFMETATSRADCRRIISN